MSKNQTMTFYMFLFWWVKKYQLFDVRVGVFMIKFFLSKVSSYFQIRMAQVAYPKRSNKSKEKQTNKQTNKNHDIFY